MSKASRSARLRSWASSASVGASPTLASASIVQRPDAPTAESSGVRQAVGPVEDEIEIPVGHQPAGRRVVDREPGVGERQSVDRLSGAGHRLRAGADEGCEIEAFDAGSRARQRNRRGAFVARDGEGKGAVSRDSQPQVEPVQLQPSNLHLGGKESERVEIDPAGGRGDHGAPEGVAHRQPAKPEAHAPGVVHQEGRAEIDRIAVADAILQARGDAVVQRLQVDRPVGEARGERHDGEEREDRRGFRHPGRDVPDASSARAPRGCR